MGDEKLRDSMPQMLGKSGGVNQGHFRPFLIRHFLGESCLYLRMVSKKWSSIPVLRLSSRCVRIMALFEAAPSAAGPKGAATCLSTEAAPDCRGRPQPKHRSLLQRIPVAASPLPSFWGCQDVHALPELGEPRLDGRHGWRGGRTG